MGIPSLLQGLKFATDSSNIREFPGQAVAVDLSSWLHKSVYSISRHYVEALEAAEADNSNTPVFPDEKTLKTSVRYVSGRCRELHRFANIPRIYLVLDGVRCPLKTVTRDQRDQRRQESLQKARNSTNNSSKEHHYKACIRIPTSLARAVAQCVAEECADFVQIVQSPYEADAQLVHLAVHGHVGAIITEDSDVLVYAAALHSTVPVIFKLQRENGKCQVIRMDWLIDPSSNENLSNGRLAPNILSAAANNKKKKNNTSALETFLQAFVHRQQKDSGKGVRCFVQACVLAGCDYSINQLSGVGLVHAFRHVAQALSKSHDSRVEHILRRKLPSRATLGITNIQEYAALLHKCEAIFYYHPVLDVSTGAIVWLQEPAIAPPEQQGEPMDDDDDDDDDDFEVKTTNHKPLLSDFLDKSFLGEVEASTSDPTGVKLLDPIVATEPTPQPKRNPTPPKRTNTIDGWMSSRRTKPTGAHKPTIRSATSYSNNIKKTFTGNPYNKEKLDHQTNASKLKPTTPTTLKGKKRKHPDIQDFLVSKGKENSDIRFCRRRSANDVKYPSTKPTVTKSRFLNAAAHQSPNKSPTKAKTGGESDIIDLSVDDAVAPPQLGGRPSTAAEASIIDSDVESIPSPTTTNSSKPTSGFSQQHLENLSIPSKTTEASGRSQVRQTSRFFMGSRRVTIDQPTLNFASKPRSPKAAMPTTERTSDFLSPVEAPVEAIDDFSPQPTSRSTVGTTSALTFSFGSKTSSPVVDLTATSRCSTSTTRWQSLCHRPATKPPKEKERQPARQGVAHGSSVPFNTRQKKEAILYRFDERSNV